MFPLTALALIFTPKPSTSLFLRPSLSPSPSSSSSTISLLFHLPLRSALLRSLRPRHGDRSSSATAASVVSDGLKILEWDKVCDVVSAFAGTALGREATREKLWVVDLSYEESQKLLEETAAAVELIKYGAGGMEFVALDTVMVTWTLYTEEIFHGLPHFCLEDSAVSRARVCLICFHIVELHLPDRVFRQFWLVQHIPELVEAIRRITSQGRSGEDWATFHASYILRWTDRLDHIAEQSAFVDPDPARATSLYMQWYWGYHKEVDFSSRTGTSTHFFAAGSYRANFGGYSAPYCQESRTFDG